MQTLAMVVDGEMKDTMFQYPDAAFLSHPPGDVDRVRHNPRAPYLVATKTIGRGLYACDVHRVWERYEEWKEEREEGQRQAGMQPSSDDDEEEEEGLGFVTLYEPTGSNISGSSTVGAGSSGAAAGTVAQGPAADGYGLCWMHNHQLVSTMAGGQVAVVVGAVADGQSTAVQLYRACSEPGSEVHDVAAAPPVLCEHVFGAATSEGEIVLWDVRAPPDAPAARKRGAHRGSCNSLAFHPHPGAPYNLATGDGFQQFYAVYIACFAPVHVTVLLGPQLRTPLASCIHVLAALRECRWRVYFQHTPDHQPIWLSALCIECIHRP